MSDFYANVLTVSISFVALILSIISLWKTRKIIDVSIEDELCPINNIYIGANNQLNGISHCTIKNGKVLFIKIVNPSPCDIGFFDLMLIDQNNQLVAYHVQGNFASNPDFKEDEIYFDTHDNQASGRLNLLKSNYGNFPANSFTRIEIPFSSENISKITVTFKVAIRSYKFNRYAQYRKCYKFFRKTININ